MIFYNPLTNAFYDDVLVHPPPGSVEISLESWKSLMEEQALGRIIKSNEDLQPVAVEAQAPNPHSALLSAAKQAVTEKAYSLFNENFPPWTVVAALTATEPEDRDAINTAGNAIQTVLQTELDALDNMSTAELKQYSVAGIQWNLTQEV